MQNWDDIMLCHRVGPISFTPRAYSRKADISVLVRLRVLVRQHIRSRLMFGFPAYLKVWHSNPIWNFEIEMDHPA